MGIAKIKAHFLILIDYACLLRFKTITKAALEAKRMSGKIGEEEPVVGLGVLFVVCVVALVGGFVEAFVGVLVGVLVGVFVGVLSGVLATG